MPVPLFIAALLLALTLAQTGCSDLLSDMGFDPPEERRAHNLSPLVPPPNEDITGGVTEAEKAAMATQSARFSPQPIDVEKECSVIKDLMQANILIAVERVVDGDTIRASNLEQSVRLWGIDAPETDQPGGQQATEMLESLLKPGELLLAQDAGTDRYGRTLAVITANNGANVNFRMVEAGWAFPYYGPGDEPNVCLETAQHYAQTTYQGLWATGRNGGIRPWDWRRGAR